MTARIAGLLCGLCGRAIEYDQADAHWRTHTWVDRVRFWVNRWWSR